MRSELTVGVLALQGGFREHGAHLRACGIEPVYVRDVAQLDSCAGLILPGGESSCMRGLISSFGFDEALPRAVRSGMKVWGTCAGAILSATGVVGEEPCLSIIDMVVERNIFGSQLASFVETAAVPGVTSGGVDLIYVRAPGIRSVGAGVGVLHESRGVITAAESDGVLATCFHPELSGSHDFHKYFCRKCGLEVAESGRGWCPESWMIDG